MTPFKLALGAAAGALAEVIGHLPLLSHEASGRRQRFLSMLARIKAQAVDLRRRVI
jgi:hypothetical protein